MGFKVKFFVLGQMKWRFRILNRWNNSSIVRNCRPHIFTNTKVMACIIIGVQCWNGPNGLLQFNCISSSYHSHPFYFVLGSLFTLTWYINILYIYFVSLTISYSSPIGIHGVFLCNMCEIIHHQLTYFIYKQSLIIIVVMFSTLPNSPFLSFGHVLHL